MPRYGEAEDYRTPEKAAELVFDFTEASKEALKPLRDARWRRAYLYYFSVHDKTMFKNAMGATGWSDGSPYKSSLFLPTVLTQVETQTPKLVLSLLANDPMFVAKPAIRSGETRTKVKAQQDAEGVQRLLHNQCIRDIRLPQQLPGWARDAVWMGTKIVFVDWVSRTGSDWAMVPQMSRASNGEMVPNGTHEFREQKGVLLEDRINATGCSLWDVFPDPRGQTVRRGTGRQCRAITRQVILDIGDLIGWIKASPGKNWWFKTGKAAKGGRMPADSQWVAELKELQGQVKGEDNYTAIMQAEVGRLANDQGEGFMPVKQDKRLIRLLDYWEPAGGKHIIVAGHKSGKRLTLLVEDNPFVKVGLPFIFLKPTPLDNHLYGLGVVDMIEQLVHQINALTNLHMTAVINETNPLILVDNLSGLTAAELVSQPFLAKDLDGSVKLSEAVEMISYPQVGGLAREEREYVRTQAQGAAGSTDFQTTGDPGNNVTARGISQFVEQNTQRFTLQVHMMGQGMCELGEVMHRIDQQYITKDRLERYEGDDGREDYMTVTVEMIKHAVELEFDARPEAANPGLRAEQFLQFVSIFGQAENFDQDEAVLEAARLLGLTRPRRFLKAQKSHAELENEIFRQTGQMPPVSPHDDHGEHIEINQLLIEDGTAQQRGPEAYQQVLNHVKSHLTLGGLAEPGPPGGGGGRAPQGQPMPGGGGPPDIGGGMMPSQGMPGGPRGY